MYFPLARGEQKMGVWERQVSAKDRENKQNKVWSGVPYDNNINWLKMVIRKQQKLL